METFRNPDGTYNGVAFFAKLTGIPEGEIAWMSRRMIELRDAGVPSADWKAIIKREAKSKPWERKP